MAECSEVETTVQLSEVSLDPWLRPSQPQTNTHLQPLSFPEKSHDPRAALTIGQSNYPIQCFVCHMTFNEQSPIPKDSPVADEQCPPSPPEERNLKPPFQNLTPQDEWLRHQLLEHKIVIHNVEEISSLKCYSDYWHRRLKQSSLKECAPVIRTNTDSNRFESEDYYLFSQSLPEDNSLRQFLHKKKLEAVLAVQESERGDPGFSRRCLFCAQILSGNRRVLFQHMLESHGFNVGQPDNLVFVKEFLDCLQEKLDSLQCLFCERTFRDRVTLKDHMRKKGHKKINAQNKTYDRFYVINYLEMGKTWKQVQVEDTPTTEEGDWLEDPAPISDSIYCLFCLRPFTTMEDVTSHMSWEHGFDFQTSCSSLGLDYYGQVKMVNYIRRKVNANSCVHCFKQFGSLPPLLDHMMSCDHFKLPTERTAWDEQQYLFPTYENDSFLCGLDDGLQS